MFDETDTQEEAKTPYKNFCGGHNKNKNKFILEFLRG